MATFLRDTTQTLCPSSYYRVHDIPLKTQTRSEPIRMSVEDQDLVDWQERTAWFRNHPKQRRMFKEIKRLRDNGHQIRLAENTLVVSHKQGEIPTTTMTLGRDYPFVAPIVTPGRALEGWWTPCTSLVEILERGANSARDP